MWLIILKVFESIFGVLWCLLYFVFSLIKNIVRFLTDFILTHKQFSLGFAICLLITIIVLLLFTNCSKDDNKPIRIYEAFVLWAETGDSMKIKRGPFGLFKKTIILSKIKAPRLDQPFGIESRDMLDLLIAKQYVRIEQYSDDPSNGGIVYNSKGECIQQKMVKGGFAWCTSNLWKKEEQEAKKFNRGIWAIYKDDIYRSDQ